MSKSIQLTLALCSCTQLAFAQATPPGSGEAPPAEPVAAPAEAPAEPEEPKVPETKPQPSESDAVFAELEEELSAPAGAAPKAPASAGPTARGGQSLNPDLAFIADFAAAWFSDAAHRQTRAHDPARTGFNLQSLELNVRSVVDPYLRFDVSIVFAEDGVEVEEAYGTTLDMPHGLQARFGQFLTRFGRINSTHPHSWDFVDQPFAIGRVFGAEGSRGLGMELSWLTPLPWYVELVGAVTHADGEESARSFRGAQDLDVEGPADLLYVLALKQFFDLDHDWSLLVGLSGAFGPHAIGQDNRTAVYGADVYLKYRPITRGSFMLLTWQTEVLHRRRQVPGEVLWDTSGFSQMSLRFLRRWGTAVRYETGSPSYDLGGNVAIDPLDPDWTRFRHRVSANVTHWPSEYSRFRLQGSRDMGGAGEPIWAAFLAAELVVGAHGAHKF